MLEAIARKDPPQPGALQLVPFAKAYSGLTDEEFRQVDALIRRSTVEKFGPCAASGPRWCSSWGSRASTAAAGTSSGIAVRFPRMLRIRHDKRLGEANTLADLEALLGGCGQPQPCYHCPCS